MTEEFDFIDSTPAAQPLVDDDDDEQVEEHVEEVTLQEGEDIDIDGENVTVHEEIIEGDAPITSSGSNTFTPSNFGFTALREYQTKHEEYLRQKAAKSHEKHQAILDKAKADIDNFYKERALKRDKAEASNRSAEQQFITDRDSNLAAGDSWESVGKLTDLQAKPLGKDTARMKQVLVQLKH